MDRLIKLPKFSYTDLDFDTIIDDIQNSIREHPEYLENWDDFLESNAGRMLLELSAYISEKTTAKADWNVREMFISTASQKESVIDILKLINYRPPLPTTSRVSLNLKLTKWAESFSIPNRERIMAADKNGQMVPFECIELADDGKPNYEYIHNVNTGNETNKIYNITGIPFYQGKTVITNDVWTEGISGERFTLSQTPVIENTIRITSLTTGKEHIEVESFISPEAQQNDVTESLKTIPYRVEVNSDGTVDIVYGHENIVDIPKKGERLEIKYRIGGGSNTNIVANTINTTKTYNISGERITVIYTNPTSAAGGSDPESVEEAKFTAPLHLRSANKTVTEEDYITTLEKHPSTLHATIVSKDNEPEDIYKEYGHFLPPLDTWIYICPTREGTEETNPVFYNSLFALSKTYTVHEAIDYEDIHLYPSVQSVFLRKLRKNMSYYMYVVLFDGQGDQWAAADSYIIGEDFEVDEINSMFTRTQTADGGSIPSPTDPNTPLTLRIFYTRDDIQTHRQKTVKYFTGTTSGWTVQLTTIPGSLYPAKPIEVWDKKLETKYVKGRDYLIDYETGVLSLVQGTDIDSDEPVIVYFADGWDADNNTLEEKMYLDYIKNKKVLCVDNYIKEARYGVYDAAIKIYTYKNMTNSVKNNIYAYIRDRFNIEKQTFGQNISKAEMSSYIMAYPGVRLAEVTYLGRDYVAYQKYVLGDISLDDIKEVGAENVEFEISAKYNEILVLSADQWDGVEVLENKKHGLIISFEEM